MTSNHSSFILVSQPEPHIGLVTLNRPEVRNAVNAATAELLEGIVARLEADDAVRAVVLTGAGGQVFCAGADLKEVAAGKLNDLLREEGGFAGFVHAKRTKPWIAAVEGLALAGGCEIALACDMIVASEGSAFGLPEVTRGLLASAGGAYRLPRALPRAIAMEMIATAGQLPVDRAVAFGMVNAVVPAGQTVAHAVALAGRIAANAPLAVRESLVIARAALDHDDAMLQRMSDAAQERLMATEDFEEGPRAFIEKRAPVWTGR